MQGVFLTITGNISVYTMARVVCFNRICEVILISAKERLCFEQGDEI